MKDLSDIKIDTSRLSLVPISLDYSQNIFEELTEEITQYMIPKSPDALSETIEYINLSQPKIQSGTDLILTILDKSGEFIGGCGAHFLNTETPTIGLWIKKSAHGKGYGKEVVTALKKWLDENTDYKYIQYPVDKRNIGSRKIAESIGGVIEDEYKKENMSGNILDEVEYRIYKNN